MNWWKIESLQGLSAEAEQAREKVLAQIIEHEENARATLLEKKAKMVYNHIGRAYGILANSHSISSKETMNLLSHLRLGVDLGLFGPTPKAVVDRLAEALVEDRDVVKNLQPAGAPKE